ncbi:hypothetical protein AB0D08_24855 [Kitasatospora sp. NPDC048540]|uniref:hypothetical protein n=1 Tax=Kitasatospora sp. NPDC048540 TaxID=3155634 RepID=UPI00340A4F5E
MPAKVSKLVRVALAAAIATSGAIAVEAFTTASAHAVGVSAVGGSITRSEILARAQSWVGQGVPYNQGAYWTDSNGTYRQDCSGFVSMAWHINTAGTNLGFTTDSADPYETQLGSLDDLRPGDALNNISTHMVLFGRWTDSGHSTAVIYEEAHTGTNARSRTMSRSEMTGGGFLPFRYKKVIEDGPTGTPVSKPLGNKGSIIASDGNQVTFTRDAGSGHLQITYLPVNGSWATADLSSTAGTAPSGGGAPAAFRQNNGTLGAVTADAQDGHLRITYKPANGAWATADLTSSFGAPVSDGDVSTQVDAVGTLSIFSRNSANGHAGLTYLPTSGVWSTFDLTDNVGTPAPGGGAPAAFLQNNGTLGVVTADAANGHLRITYKPAAGGWATSDLTSGFNAATSDGNVSSVIGGDVTLAIYSRNASTGHLNLAYLPTGGAWGTTDMTGEAGTPALG